MTRGRHRNDSDDVAGDEAGAADEVRVADEVRLAGSGRLLAGRITHALNNHLLPITLVAELVRDDAMSDDRLRANMATILDAAERAGSLLDRLDRLSRSDEVDLRPEALGEIAGLALERLRLSASGNIAFRVDLGEAGCPVRADAGALAEAIVAIGENALEAIGDAPGTIDFALDRVSVSEGGAAPPAGLAPGLHARLVIADSGPGLSAATLRQVFEPLFTTKGGGGSRGLGLTIALGIVAAHGGAMCAASAAEDGARFEIYLPIQDL